MTQAPTPGPLSGKYRVKEQKCGWVIISPKGAVVGHFHKEQDARDMARSFNVPTPGPPSVGQPLTKQTRGQLCDGDWLREDWNQGRLIQYRYPHNIADYRLPHTAFIGRPDADGWMPWPGGENPVPGRVVEIELRGLGLIGPDLSDHFDWRHEADNEDQDVIAFRLAPTAPVEASGSEREHGPMCWGKTSLSDEMAHCYCGSTDLRPQPSGETREAVRLALEDADALDRVSEEADDNQWQDWAATMRQAASRIRRLALLSTSPLALGGQQGDSETLRVLLDNLVIAQTLSKDIRQKATDEACSYLYDRRTTPARAEAQDEDTPCTDCGDTGVTHQTERRCSCQEAEAPAADADRVREEETEVQYEVWGAGPQGDFCAGSDTLSDAQHYAAIYGQDGPVVIKVATTSRVVWPEASPALKSTAAKEGGKG